MIQGNPNIKAENKPNSASELYTMSWEIEKKKERKILTPEELESIKHGLMEKINNK